MKRVSSNSFSLKIKNYLFVDMRCRLYGLKNVGSGRKRINPQFGDLINFLCC